MTLTPAATRRRLVGWAALATQAGLALWLTAGQPAVAQAQAQPAWPSKPVHLVVAFPPGGLADVMVRLLQNPLSEALGQPVVIENKGGANGNVAADAVIRGPQDHHSFAVSSTGIESANPFMYARMPFNPGRDLQHVALLANTQLFLVTRPTLPADDLKGFVAYARSHPGQLSYGSAGSGSTPHLAGELFKQYAQVFATHLPYRGAAPALQDVLAGQIDFAFVPGTAFGYVKAGKLKLLAVASAQRSPGWPSAPTFVEQGIGPVLADTLFGVYAPSGTAPEAVARLNREINKLLATPQIKARYAELGAQALPLSPAEFKALVAEETRVFSAVIKARRIAPD
ncbi:MAG: ABC transporter substrate-binding protein [Burkholderiales bacterium PBB5]|nr:MAG: ABC transporter substrate-binding protein [Burkholderiales bacterium PBB5]